MLADKGSVREGRKKERKRVRTKASRNKSNDIRATRVTKRDIFYALELMENSLFEELLALFDPYSTLVESCPTFAFENCF